MARDLEYEREDDYEEDEPEEEHDEEEEDFDEPRSHRTRRRPRKAAGYLDD